MGKLLPIWLACGQKRHSGKTHPIREQAMFAKIISLPQSKLLIQIGGANIQARNTESGAVPLHEALQGPQGCCKGVVKP
ncbi:hypothetical protein NQ318_002458 [Aromia moschata]|uniref:Uncharacterized protein n=1 Tax=Aromia moschata TaxID=1265417 RepID=A0AAV8Y9I5_9CUCU|nr:hypothetical protein NQ318_002458 [Aromia moschata]